MARLRHGGSIMLMSVHGHLKNETTGSVTERSGFRTFPLARIGGVHLQPVRFLVRRNLGLSRSPAAMAVPNKRSPTLYSVLRNLANLHSCGLRGPPKASQRTAHACPWYSMAVANLCAASCRMGVQAQMVSDGLAHSRRTQRVG